VSNEKLVQMCKSSLDDYCQSLNEAEMRQMFGDDAEAIQVYANVPRNPTMKGDSLVIFLPGLTGSVLEDVGPANEVLWLNPLAMLRGHLNHLNLAPDGQTDATPGVKISAPRPLWLAYARIILRLQHELDVVVFPFDWRKLSTGSALLLRDVIERELAAHPQYQQVTLIGHSMGGLVIADYLSLPETQAHAEKHVKRAITLGTPFRGAMEALLALANPNDPKFSVIAKTNAGNNAHQMLLTFPGIYQLLPAPNGLYPNWNPVPELDIYAPAIWETIGVPISHTHLAAARQHHELYATADPQVPMHCVIGTFYETPALILGKMLNMVPQKAGSDAGEGDGTVEVASAVFNNRPAYFLQEQHIELVLDQDVIEAVLTWAEGGQPTTLVRSIGAVAKTDKPLRTGASGPVSRSRVTQKISTDTALTNAEIKALMGFSTLRTEE